MESPKWVQEQVRKGLNISEELNIKEEIEKLSVDTLISFFTENKDATFSKNGRSPENSAAHITAYQKVLNLLDIPIDIDGIWGKDTKTALQDFQKANNLNPDGIPGPKTVAKIIEKLKEKNSKIAKEDAETTTQQPKEDAETTTQQPKEDAEIGEKDKIAETIKNAKIRSMIYPMNTSESFYNGSSPTLIDYAIVKQDDGEYYIYDKPLRGVRTVYRTTANFEVISSAQVQENGKIVLIKGTPMRAPYMPTPIMVK